ncbi:hypothetical protein LSUB1_G005194 [Lachnellula subtilissima]|uniref:Uncharacterized protein n=1 Tax=Lachnellula subtilissima TaxID=602034 RepID=A0A8H8RJH7_9HELO|nr:hypothetical protein LSUB1_G005194 [Lachnellula subtilissima]
MIHTTIEINHAPELVRKFVEQNSPTMFQWQGPPVVGISGLHTFSFEPSKVAEGGTTFVHKEEFSGAMAFLMQSWLVGWSMPGKFDGFNRDLKKRVENLGNDT